MGSPIPQRFLTALLALAVAVPGTVPAGDCPWKVPPSAGGAALRLVESAESGLEEQLTHALDPARAAPIRAQAGMEEKPERPPDESWWFSRAIERLMGILMSRGTFVKQGAQLMTNLAVPPAPAMAPVSKPAAPSDVAQTIRGAIGRLRAVGAAIGEFQKFSYASRPSTTIAQALQLRDAAEALQQARQISSETLSQWLDGPQMAQDLAQTVAQAQAGIVKARVKHPLVEAMFKGVEVYDRAAVMDSLPDVLHNFIGIPIGDPAWQPATSALNEAVHRSEAEWRATLAAQITALLQRERPALAEEARQFLEKFGRVEEDPFSSEELVKIVLGDVALRAGDVSEYDARRGRTGGMHLRWLYQDRQESLALTSQYWQAVVRPIEQRWGRAGIPPAFIRTHLKSSGFTLDNWLKNPTGFSENRYRYGLRAYYDQLLLDRIYDLPADDSFAARYRELEDLRAIVKGSATSELERHAGRPEELFEQIRRETVAAAAARDATRARRSQPLAPAPPPWHDLAHVLADAARTSTVWVTMRLDAAGALADLSWQPVGAPRPIPAAAALVTQLRDAGWPRGGEPFRLYARPIAPGTSPETLAVHLRQSLTVQAWQHLEAGMEEGRKQWWDAPLPRRIFLKGSGQTVAAVTQMATGSEPVAPPLPSSKPLGIEVQEAAWSAIRQVQHITSELRWFDERSVHYSSIMAAQKLWLSDMAAAFTAVRGRQAELEQADGGSAVWQRLQAEVAAYRTAAEKWVTSNLQDDPEVRGVFERYLKAAPEGQARAVLASPRWQAAKWLLTARWGRRGVSAKEITDVLNRTTANDLQAWFSGKGTRHAYREASRRILERRVEADAALRGRQWSRVHDAVKELSGKQLDAALQDYPKFVEAMTTDRSSVPLADPVPWRRLASAIARVGRHHSVVVAVTTDPDGRLLHVRWTADSFHHRAAAELLAPLLASRWPFAAQPSTRYTRTVAAGTPRDAVAAILQTLDNPLDTTWERTHVLLDGFRPQSGLEEGPAAERPWDDRSWPRLATEA